MAGERSDTLIPRAVVWPLAAIAAGVLTLTLAGLMQALIAPDGVLDYRAADRSSLDFVRVRREQRPPPPDNRPQRPPPPQLPPRPPALPVIRPLAPRPERVPVMPVPVEVDIQLSATGFTLGAQEGEFLPLLKVAPIYPHRARRRGVEGFCVVEYRVTPEGTTTDVRVIEDECTSSLFHEASREAARKFRYKPRVVDGVAIAVPKVRNRFVFRLER